MAYPFIVEKKKGRKITFIAVKLANKPGALSKIVQILAKYKINILSGVIEAPLEKEYAYWISQLDITEVKENFEKIVEEMSSLDVVYGIEHGIKEIGKILVPSFNVSISTLGGEAILERDEWLSELYKALDQYFGVAGQAFMYQLGFRAGYHMGEKWEKFARVSGIDLFILGLEVFKVLNWVKNYEILEFDEKKKRIRFRLYDSFECRPFRGKGEGPRSHYLRGILAGFLSHILSERISLTEVKCLCKGDEYCEFVSRKPSLRLLTPV
ncbi:MAG: hypothetical protein DRN04_06430 [Thermoprotei archaeon]|nr:MAG: hypothetical protein DRN04_06430 [Thermoprotei archaeon]